MLVLEVFNQCPGSDISVHIARSICCLMAIAEQSLASFGYELISRPDTAQVVVDHYIMAILAMVWMYRDSKNLSKR